MIANELNELLKNCNVESADFDLLVDQFRADRDAAELLELLNCDDDDLVRIGAWILSEIRAAKYDDESFKARLWELTSHPTAAIRLHSLNALFPFLRSNDPGAMDLIARLQSDENAGVRMMADAIAKRLEVEW